MRKTFRFLLPLLLLCTLLFSVTAMPAFAAIEYGQASESAEYLKDTVTGAITRLEYEYLVGYTSMITYDSNLIISLPFVAELIVDIVFGLVAAWTLIYILWRIKVFPNGTGFDRVMEPCGKYFYKPFVENILSACGKLCKNANKLQAGFYWAVLGLGTVHVVSRLVLNILIGTFSLAAQVLIPLACLALLLLIMGNGSFLSFRAGNFLSVVCSVGVLAYLGFSLYASFVAPELTIMVWIQRVAMMALALFFLGVIANQWAPAIVGSTMLQAGGVLYLIFGGVLALVRAYTIPGSIFVDLYYIGIVVLFYFAFVNVRYTPAPAEEATTEDASEEVATETTEEVAEDVATDETATEEVTDEATAEEDTPVEDAVEETIEEAAPAEETVEDTTPAADQPTEEAVETVPVAETTEDVAPAEEVAEETPADDNDTKEA